MNGSKIKLDSNNLTYFGARVSKRKRCLAKLQRNMKRRAKMVLWFRSHTSKSNVRLIVILLVQTRRVPVQRAVERDEIPYP